MFLGKLAELKRDPEGRQWFFVAYDQLTDEIGPLSEIAPNQAGIILIENHSAFRQRPFHQQKIAFQIANQRQFAIEQAIRGVAVDYVFSTTNFRDPIRQLLTQYGPLKSMEPSEFQLREELKPLVAENLIQVVPHPAWITSTEEFITCQALSPPWRMDSFYRSIRKKTGILMDGKKPIGGKFSFDAENRRFWKGHPAVPDLLQFPTDPIKAEVCEMVRMQFNEHPGTLNVGSIPSTRQDAMAQWQWAKDMCMENFGPYEDSMSTDSSNIFHTRISSLLNNCRLLPAPLVADVLELDIPINSKEGFIRQVLGWREFVRHVHMLTDGFRRINGRSVQIESEPGSGGYENWSQKRWIHPGNSLTDGGSAPSELGASNQLPPAYWGQKSGLNCLDIVVSNVWQESHSHHITRLMILCNIATLLDISPRQITDWFWIAYTDAYDWVVEPNVLGMGTFALGDLFTTKPYISGSAYISRMSDFCVECCFSPKRDCPIARLYWAFLQRHHQNLTSNPRMLPVLRSLSKRPHKQQHQDHKVYRFCLRQLHKGEMLTPEDMVKLADSGWD